MTTHQAHEPAAPGDMIEQHFPAGPPVTPAQLLGTLRQAPEGGRLRFGDERVRAFLGALSRRLLDPALSRIHPELTALGYFLRPAEISRTLDRLHDPTNVMRFPRGLVFHVPPANVDTVFMYSWALSALAGNTNVIRMSARAGDAAAAILRALHEVEAAPVVAQTQRLVAYARSEAVTGEFSAACDLRVIWGGDEAVNAVRRHPLQPTGRDLTFPDRSSLAVISIAGWQAADADRKRAAADGFATDAYWFGQAACSSPRTVLWIGTPDRAARAEFEELLGAAAEARGFVVDAAMAVEKRVSAYGMAAQGDVEEIRFRSNTLATLELSAPARMPRRWLGTGTFAHCGLGTLDELPPLLGRKDQTLAAFGFDEQELREFARRLGGRGIDRIVPFGSALAFSEIWDGYDLLREFSRLTRLTC